MAGRPYLAFYVGDWRKDPAVSMCSITTRGIWLELLFSMHELEVPEITGTPENIGRLIRATEEEVQKAIDELESTDTAEVSRSSNGVVTILSRRMLCDLDGIKTNREQSRERTRRHREKKRSSNTSVTDESRSCNAPVLDIDIEDDIEIVSEEKERKFLCVWDLYDHKKGKTRARRAWDSLTSEERTAVFNHVRSFVGATPNKNYRPHFSSYLNGRRWEDEELPQQEKNGTTKKRTTGQSFDDWYAEGETRRSESPGTGETLVPDEPKQISG